MKKKHLRCLLVLLVAVCMVCSIAVPVCAEVLPSAQIGTPETALESDTEKDNTPTPTPTDTPTPEPAPSEAPSTPETSEPAATSETAAPAAPSLDEITTMLYSDLPDAPTGYYVGEYGLPVGTGQTKISLSAWQDELLDESSQGRLDADALNTDTSAMAVAKQPGQDYAIVPIVMQVEYPANGSATTVTLPDDVDLLSYASTEDHLVTASEEERAQILNASYKDSSASASGFYVKATEDFSVTFTYSAPDGTTISKKLDVSINGSAEAAVLPASNSNGVSTYANTPQPPFTTGKITKIEYVVSTWLVWFNGLEAYCCDNGLYAAPGGCPTYNFAYVSKLEPGQYTPGNHYANQVNIWGGLNQLSLGVLTEKHDSTTFSGSEFAANLPSLYSAAGTDTLGKAYQYYDDTQLWIIEHYPNSVAAQTYMKAAAALENNGLDVRPYLGNGGYYTFAYFPPAGYNWQRIVVIGPEIDEDDDTSELPETPEMQYYSADWTAPPQSASGSFDLTYTVHIDKSANITHEKLDDAIFKLTPNPSSGTISGGTWTIGDPQIVTTVDGAASATWTLHYEVTKTSTTTLSGKEGPYNTQEEANAAAEAAKNNAIAQLQTEAQAMVDAAIAEAKAQLAKITIDYEETTVPHGFDPTDSSSGSVSVPSNGSTTAVVANQPWQAHVTWEKRDALTGGRITEDAEYVFYEWNVDANEYEISSNYRVTRLENGLYTVTVTNPVYTDWTEGYVYYTQDNLGKFRIEEVAAPAGYTDAALQGTDWVEHWSQEFEITASDQTYSYTGDDADYNRPQGNKVIIKKIEAHTGEIIVDDAVFTLYQWNEERGLYEKSKDYAFVRDTEGLYTITCLHDDWSQYEEGNLYYEDTLCDVREDTVNSDGTTTEHPQYYTDYEPIDFSIDERAVTNDGQFVVVESKSPYGYYGDWTGDEDRTNYEAEDAGKRAYYIRLTDDGSTITIGNGNYNANVLTENQGGTLIDLGDKVVSLEVFGEAATEYPEDALYKNNPWYSSLTWEKRDALTGGRITEDAEYEIQEWNPEKGQYEKSTHYRVVRRDDGLYTVNLIDGAFFPGWEGKQGYELQDLVSIGYPAAIRRIGQELDALRQDAALFQSSLRKDDKGNEMFSAVIQGVTYTKRADADAALLEACKAAAAGAGEKKIGRYCGFDICVGYDPKIIGFAGYLQGEQRYRIELNPKQNFSSFRAVLENISAQIPVKIAAREEIEKNIESAKEAAKQPFAYEEEFQTKLARLNELNILLDQEKQELVQNEKENRMQKENVNLHAEENEDWEASTVEPAAKLPAGWKWTMYSDGSGRLEGPDKQSLYSYDRMTYASAGEIEYRKSNNSSWDVFPEGSLDRFREWAEQQLLQELKKEPLQYQEFLEHQSHQDDEIEKNPLDMEDAARQAGLTVQRDQDKPGAAYFDADQNVIHVSDAGSEEDVRLSELKGYADAVIQRTATVEQPVRDLESASLAVMLAARYDVGVSDRLSQQLASAHAEAVKCPTFDLPVTLQRLDKALDYCDHFLAHEQERALEQEAENEPEPEQVTELSPQSQAFMMDL